MAERICTSVDKDKSRPLRAELLWGVSAETVRNIDQVTFSAVEFAKAQKLIFPNPKGNYALAKLEHQEMKTLTAERVAPFLRETLDQEKVTPWTEERRHRPGAGTRSSAAADCSDQWGK